MSYKLRLVPRKNSLFLGKFRMGDSWIQLYACKNLSGGDFTLTPENKEQPRIRIGIDDPSLEQTCGILIHEAFEASMASHNIRYEHSGKWNSDSSDCLFVMNHPQFGRVASDVGEFICRALPALALAHGKAHKK